MEIGAGDYRLAAAPNVGGSIRRFDSGAAVLRPAAGPSILDAACFPLVPFSNRIAHGRFAVAGQEVGLRPNFPSADHPHPLHGFGWLLPWTVVRHEPGEIVMEHLYQAGAASICG